MAIGTRPKIPMPRASRATPSKQAIHRRTRYFERKKSQRRQRLAGFGFASCHALVKVASLAFSEEAFRGDSYLARTVRTRGKASVVSVTIQFTHGVLNVLTQQSPIFGRHMSIGTSPRRRIREVVVAAIRVGIARRGILGGVARRRCRGRALNPRGARALMLRTEMRDGTGIGHAQVSPEHDSPEQ